MSDIYSEVKSRLTPVLGGAEVESAVLDKGVLSLIVKIRPEAQGNVSQLKKIVERILSSVPNVEKVSAVFTAHAQAASKVKVSNRSSGLKPNFAPKKAIRAKKAKKTIAIASGKGGVGKSTTAINLAVALSKFGLNIGLLDCDIYGPSVHHLLGDVGEPSVTKDGLIIPMERHGIRAISMGYFLETGEAAIWRGPMLIRAIKQLLDGVAWSEFGELDVLLIDMPPGTGDVPLSLASMIDLDGAVVVSTPQDIAFQDVSRSMSMFDKADVKILGLVENMNQYVCPKCNEPSRVFGLLSIENKAHKMGVEFLGGIPLLPEINLMGDRGIPVASEGNTALSASYFALADRLRKIIQL